MRSQVKSSVKERACCVFDAEPDVQSPRFVDNTRRIEFKEEVDGIAFDVFRHVTRCVPTEDAASFRLTFVPANVEVRRSVCKRRGGDCRGRETSGNQLKGGELRVIRIDKPRRLNVSIRNTIQVKWAPVGYKPRQMT